MKKRGHLPSAQLSSVFFFRCHCWHVLYKIKHQTVCMFYMFFGSPQLLVGNPKKIAKFDLQIDNINPLVAYGSVGPFSIFARETKKAFFFQTKKTKNPFFPVLQYPHITHTHNVTTTEQSFDCHEPPSTAANLIIKLHAFMHFYSFMAIMDGGSTCKITDLFYHRTKCDLTVVNGKP